MASDDELPNHTFLDPDAFGAWIRDGHDGAPSAWLHFAKKGSDATTMTRDEAVLVALCWGWIDGKLNTVDDDYFKIRFQPRRPRGVWSKINVAHVERLVAEGRMQPPGLAQVEAAKADGRWDAAYGSSASTMDIPPELQAKFDAEPALQAAYAARPAGERFRMCFRIQTAKRGRKLTGVQRAAVDEVINGEGGARVIACKQVAHVAGDA